MKREIYWLCVAIWMGLIFYLSSLRIGGAPGEMPSWLMHMGVYFVLGLLLGVALMFDFDKKKVLLIGLIIGVLYGFSDEVHQFFVPGRVFSLWDIFFDGLGSLIGLIAMRLDL